MENESKARKPTGRRYSDEVRERAIRMVLEHQHEYETQGAAIRSIASKMGMSRETLRNWIIQAERDRGQRSGATSSELARLKELERENRELRTANEILRKASAYFAPGGARPPIEAMIAFIDEHRDVYGVEPICRLLPIAPSTYYWHAGRRSDPEQWPTRVRRDAELKALIRAVWDENFGVYGVRKVWRQLLRDGVKVARCTVARLMRMMGLEGVRRGRRIKTTQRDDAVPCPLDRVKRQFRADRPNALWVADFTYCWTWSGFVYVAFVTDVFARRIVGWRVSTSMRTDFVLDALNQALHDRQPPPGLIHHSDHGSQYLSIRYTERLVDAGVQPSAGSVGDSYDNALAETINGLYKAEVVHRRSWRTLQDVELATLEWVHWYNHHRLLGPLGYVSPAEAEEAYNRNLVLSAR
ncbi:IS3 family transposase, partial [Caballeronia terrestris]|uniref:IS3 family transposase n=1 Tax=Caballeronia terrestris TaxID=1226301 RepID=UPI001F21D367